MSIMSTAILPGVYVDVKAGDREKPFSTVGVVTMPLDLSWGDTVIVLDKGENPIAKLGYYLKDIKLVKEVMNYANRLILYRLNDGDKATATLSENVTATALYGGERGNSINITVSAVDSSFVVKTYLDIIEVDSQVISKVSDFKPNGFITLSGEGALAVCSSVVLTGGTNSKSTVASLDKYLLELEKHDYNIIAYTGTDSAGQKKIVDFVNRMRDENHVMIQAVMSGSDFNNKGIINNTIGGVTNDYELTAHEACATMAGIQASCGIDNSATYFDRVVGWTDVSERLTKLQQEIRTQKGEILFVMKYNKVMALYDINSLVSFTEINPKDFSKNLVVRTLDMYAKQLQYLLDTKAIGKIRNSEQGRNQIKGMIAEMTTTNYANKGYIESFLPQDIVINTGLDRDSVTVTVGITVADTVDKIFITVISI